ncbi:MAG: glutamate 5-kinase [Spirochaetes bacterium]|nr:glutamate 5-kinase [Spirochaetota bacterium]
MPMRDFKRLPHPIERLVIKIGSSLLTKEGRIHRASVARFVDLIARLREKGCQTALVTSGAVASARHLLPVGAAPTLAQKQALASVGQVHLMELYRKEFEKRGHKVGQVLLSEYLLKHRPSWLNARTTLTALFDLGVIPVINENDVMSVEELKFDSNDALGAVVCGLMDADLYIILSDVDGLFRRFGTPEQSLIETVRGVDASVEKEAGLSRSAVGTGGMASKVSAARRAGRFSVPTLIANGRTKTLWEDLFARGRGTLFYPPDWTDGVSPEHRQANRKKAWLASTIHPSGKLFVDGGAVSALLERHSSLLPSGVLRVEGNFHGGDVVAICAEDGRELARGVSAYASYEIRKIQGHKTSEIPALLGYRNADEVVHRDNLMVL